jgi:hypothetical protein
VKINSIKNFNYQYFKLPSLEKISQHTQEKFCLVSSLGILVIPFREAPSEFQQNKTFIPS